MADSKEHVVENILRNLTRFINGLTDENRNTRKRSLEGIRKEILNKKPQLEPTDLQNVLKGLVKPLLQVLSDPVEKCRDLSLCFMTDCLRTVPEPYEFLPFIIPVAVQRLGQQDIVEPSEEIRLSLVKLLLLLVESCKKKMGPYVDEMVKILQRTIIDPFPEVKKESCHCASSLAKAVPGFFHMQSESLVKPLLMSISHQHSRVRVDVIKTIGDVIQYGNGKSVDDVVSHLAQRLFDNSPMVRAMVIQVVGQWLLDLPDRYSFHYKLIPLLLSGITDEVAEIRSQADALWNDVGVKYEGENEKDLKDLQDFPPPDPDHYPPGVEPPNLGCRKLVYHNFSKIVPGIVNDITDWVAPTRIKSAHLLYTLMLSEGDNVTQHLEKVLGGMYRAATDDEQEVVKYVEKSAELIGYFVLPKVWCKMVLDGVRLMQSVGSLIVLAAVIRGSQQVTLKPHIDDIVGVITEPALCRVADASLQYHLLACVDALTVVMKEDCTDVSLSLFSLLITVLALQRADIVKDQVHKLLVKLAEVQQLEEVQDLYNMHTRVVVAGLKENYTVWTQHSLERHIFDTLLMESGPVVGEILDDVIPMLTENLHPDKDPELRLKCFTLLSRLVLKSDTTLNSHDKFGEFVVTVVRDMIMPNCVWKAGRVAKAIRTTAVSCLWALLQSGALNKDRLLEVMEELMTQLRSTLEDDNMSTRLVTCRVMTRILSTVGTSLDDHRLHNMYPELLKRLDDSNDDVRIAVTDTWLAYLACFQDDYQVELYRAHLEAIYKGLLIHLDDPDTRIQDAVLEVLKKAGTIEGRMLLDEVEAVKTRHRSTKYCDSLASYIRELPQKPSVAQNGYS